MASLFSHLFMEAEPTIHQLKRSADEPSSNRDGPPQKRRNTGSILDLRRTRGRANAYVNSTGGTLTDPLNLNNAAPESSAQSFVERKRRFDDAPAGVYQRRVSFRLPKKRPDQLVTPTTEEPDSKVEARKNKQASMNLRYRYGNFNYFQKTSAHFQNDPRLDLMVEDWFLNKAVLDIGCNSGYLTLSIARTFGPRRILGIDIDSHLIDAARKNIRHFQDKDLKIATKFPASFALNYGPTSAPTTSTSSEFPNNVWFRTENYILESDEELENVKEEYDSILAFSITKWIHLNWGDAGLQRFFKRVYRQLKPGGRFVFEPQSSRGYRKRAKMTEEINKTYKTIKFWPESYVSFLMSIGFCHYEALDTPLVQLLDCDAPILMFYKGPLAGWKNSPAPNQQQVYEASEFGDQPQIISFTTPRAESQYSSTPRDDPNSPSTPDFSRND
ncbi:RNA methyltransferase [Aphelenchoides bicaudatus]|nr:RNA methyltransferase [Aphelenchoides bicaudatus]